MFGGGDSAAKTPALSALSIQSMGYGVPIQICYGTNRVSPILGWTADFEAVEAPSSSGGKMFGGGASGGGSYSYYSAIMLFIGEGATSIRGFGKVWRDKDIYDNITKAGFTFAVSGGQDVWGYIATKHPDQALTYRPLALVAASKYPLRDGATLGNHSIEVFGRKISETDTDQNYIDAHIKEVISDFLNNTRYGAIDGNTASLTLDMAAMHDYTVARNLLISPLLTEQRQAYEYLKEWALIANSGIVWSEGKLKFIPYADQDFTNAYGSYTADTTIRYTFDNDNIEEPITVIIKKKIDCYNQVTVECLNRNNAYNKLPVPAADQSDVENFGLRDAETIVLHAICVPATAKIVAHTELQRGLYIRKEYTIKGWCDADLLEPLDFITLPDDKRCRVKSITDSQDGRLTITAEEAPEGVYCG